MESGRSQVTVGKRTESDLVLIAREFKMLKLTCEGKSGAAWLCSLSKLGTTIPFPSTCAVAEHPLFEHLEDALKLVYALILKI